MSEVKLNSVDEFFAMQDRLSECIVADMSFNFDNLILTVPDIHLTAALQAVIDGANGTPCVCEMCGQILPE